MSYEDRTLTCQDCSQPFTFSAEDQTYHAEKGYTNEPKRCLPCRQARRNDRSYGGGGGVRSRPPRDAPCDLRRVWQGYHGSLPAPG